MARKVEDAGDKVGGARKDIWRERALGLEDLSGLSVREAEKFVTKELVWPAPDYEDLLAKGWDAEGAALLKVIRDRVAVAPNLTMRDPATRLPLDPAEARRLYVSILTTAREALRDARTVAGVKAAVNELYASVGYTGRNVDPGVRNLLLQANGPQARNGAFYVSYKELDKVRRLVADGFPTKVPAWRKGLRTRQDGKGQWQAARKSGAYWKIVADGFADEAALLAHVEAQAAETKAKAAKGPKPPPDRPHLDDLRREGLPDVRGGRDVTPQEFIETFGFRSVEFGEWVPDGERQVLLNHGYDAMQDLAGALGLEPGQVGFGGRLSAAFGARGNGSALAHYEPLRRIFNLTRLRGAGSLAHEYGHALDDLAGDLGRNGRGGLSYATGGHDRLRTLAGTLPGLGAAEAAWQGMMEALWERPRTREEAVADTRAYADEIEAKVVRIRGNVAKHRETVEEARQDRKWLRSADEWCEANARTVVRVRERAEEYAAAAESGDFGRKETDFLKEAKALCGKSGTYYVRPCEMFARAFESAVFDVIAERGGRSDYLVHGVEETRYADKGTFSGNPYPAGAEREAFKAAFRRLAEAMAEPITELSAGSAPVPGAGA